MAGAGCAVARRSDFTGAASPPPCFAGTPTRYRVSESRSPVYNTAVQIRAGTSGWSYPAWRGRFYPAGLPSERMLATYATQLDAVEVNATYYRMPRPAMLAGWRGQVPERFRFALKAPMRLPLLKGGADKAMAAFVRAAAALGDRLGPLLLRPPPGPPDPGWLRDFLALVPRGRQAIFEPREPGWVRDDVLAVLSDAGTVLCATDSEDGEGPLVPTATSGYLRLRRADYAASALARWAERIAAQPWGEAYVFFRHEDEARGPRLARAFLDAWGGGAAASLLRGTRGA
jgi:uncharacterized protein YecE (DUF72 family)